MLIPTAVHCPAQDQTIPSDCKWVTATVCGWIQPTCAARQAGTGPHSLGFLSLHLNSLLKRCAWAELLSREESQQAIIKMMKQCQLIITITTLITWNWWQQGGSKVKMVNVNMLSAANKTSRVGSEGISLNTAHTFYSAVPTLKSKRRQNRHSMKYFSLLDQNHCFSTRLNKHWYVFFHVKYDVNCA